MVMCFFFVAEFQLNMFVFSCIYSGFITGFIVNTMITLARFFYGLEERATCGPKRGDDNDPLELWV